MSQIQRHQSVKNPAVFDVFFTVLLFVVALLPRSLALGVFLTPDEYRWLGRSRNFLVALLTGDWGSTLQTGHPGVTTMWTGSLGLLFRYWTGSFSTKYDLLSFVQQVPNEPPEAAYIAPVRLPTVVLMSFFVVAFYALVSRLYNDRRVGMVAALLLALHPFHIGLSRVLHNDALATAFMTISLLALLGYWLQSWSWRWLLLSAVIAGLSILSKSPAIFLMPFCALLGLIASVQRWYRGEWRGWPDVRRLVANGLLWGVIAWLTVWLLWPAMWVTPLEVLATVFGTASKYSSDGHISFFLGQITRDPGPLFYPSTWLFRTTPLTVLGLLIWIGTYLRAVRSRRTKGESSVRVLSVALLLYAGLFVAFMTLGEKKQERYILPIYPVLSVLAAMGLVYVSNIVHHIPMIKYRIHNPLYLIPLVVLLIQGPLAIANYPYYFTYYNPLFGGVRTAARVITVGWGEGLEQAAAYLDSLPGADHLQVKAWYHYTFATYFRGQVSGFSSKVSRTLDSDYAVVYRSQIQRELPTPETVRYLLGHYTPVFTVTLHGVDYVYVYRLPFVLRSDELKSRLPGQASFLGVGETEPTDALTGNGAEMDPFSLRLYWQNDGLAANQEWWVALQPVNGPQQPWQRCSLSPDFANERLTVGAVLESQCQLAGERFPPDVYHLQVGVGSDPNQITVIPFPEGELAVAAQDDGSLHLVPRLTALNALARHTLPQGAHPTDLVYYGTVRLIGYTTEKISTDEGRQLQVHVYWQALEPVPVAGIDQAVRIEGALLSPEGMVLAMTEGPFGDSETWPAMWSAGQVLTTALTLPLPDSVPPQSQLKINVLLNSQRQSPLNSRGETVEPSLPAFLAQ